MKWILLIELIYMESIYSASHSGGVSVHTQYFSTKAQCETVARDFLNGYKATSLQRRAMCIKLQGDKQ